MNFACSCHTYNKMHFFSQSNFTHSPIFNCPMGGNKHYDVDFTLDKLEEILNPKQFFRINRQYIVNIDAYWKYGNCYKKQVAT